MTRYRKLSLEVEAAQFLGLWKDDHNDPTPRFSDWPDWLRAALASRRITLDAENDALIVETREGRMRVRNGTWIVQGVVGELYPVQEHIFPQLYADAANEHR